MKDNDMWEGVFSIEANDLMPAGRCAMFLDGEMIYAGWIKDSPIPDTGFIVIVSPEDYDSLHETVKNSIN